MFFLSLWPLFFYWVPVFSTRPRVFYAPCFPPDPVFSTPRVSHQIPCFPRPVFPTRTPCFHALCFPVDPVFSIRPRVPPRCFSNGFLCHEMFNSFSWSKNAFHANWFSLQFEITKFRLPLRPRVFHIPCIFIRLRFLFFNQTLCFSHGWTPYTKTLDPVLRVFTHLLLCSFAPSPLRPFAPSPLRPCAPSPLRPFAPPPLRPSAPPPLRPSAPPPLRPSAPPPLRPSAPPPLRPSAPPPLRPSAPPPLRPSAPPPLRPSAPPPLRPSAPPPLRPSAPPPLRPSAPPRGIINSLYTHVFSYGLRLTHCSFHVGSLHVRMCFFGCISLARVFILRVTEFSLSSYRSSSTSWRWFCN